MTDLAEKRLERILEEWQDERYRRTPLGDFAHEDLPRLGRKIIAQVLEDMENYLQLLQAWPGFVEMIESIPDDDDNRWLFRS